MSDFMLWDEAIDSLLRPGACLGEPTAQGKEGSLPFEERDRVELHALHYQLMTPYLLPIDGYIQRLQRGERHLETFAELAGLLRPLIELSEAVELPSQGEPLRVMADHATRLSVYGGTIGYTQVQPIYLAYERMLLGIPEAHRPPRGSPHFYNGGSVAFLEALRQVRQIGPRRLQRLYAAGLVEASIVAKAQAEELNHVTGLGLRLSQTVIAAAQGFLVAHRQATLRGLVEGCHSLTKGFLGVGPGDQDYLEALLPCLPELARGMEHIKGLTVTSNGGKLGGDDE